MADNPQKPGDPQRGRPTSPHLTIYRWPATMITSITHRITGVGLSLGLVVLAWWLVCISNGPEGYESFHAVSDSPPGLLILFGLAWALSFHFLSGIRHLAWDLGYGFGKDESRRMSVIIIVLSLVFALAIFACAWTGHAGYLQ
jgi:succinate dehydrogenase / fumarate reductase cytochrome b subunit